MSRLAETVAQFLRRHQLLSEGGLVLVALSGGPDSVALLRLLLELRDSRTLDVRLHAAHLNHGLRGAEADRDEAFCRRLAEKFGLPIEVEHADVAASRECDGGCEEEVARRLRYGFLAGLARKVGARAVATGHQADDVAETVLMRLLRGAALRGLGAIPPSRPIDNREPPVRLIRPLLGVRREQVLHYLAQVGQDFQQDATNRSERHTRNRVRHWLIPLLEAEFPTFAAESLAHLNQSALEVRRLLERLVDEQWLQLLVRQTQDETVLDAQRFAALPHAVRKAACEHALRHLTAGPVTLRAEHYGQLATMAEADVGDAVDLPHGLRARREHGVIWFGRAEARRRVPERPLPVPGRVTVPEAGMQIECRRTDGIITPVQAECRSDERTIYARGDLLGERLLVRSRQTGDRFHPLGAPGTRRLKEFFIDCKVPLHIRDRVPVVVTAQGTIVWVVGYRMADAFRIPQQGAEAVRLSARQLPAE